MPWGWRGTTDCDAINRLLDEASAAGVEHGYAGVACRADIETRFHGLLRIAEERLHGDPGPAPAAFVVPLTQLATATWSAPRVTARPATVLFEAFSMSFAVAGAAPVWQPIALLMALGVLVVVGASVALRRPQWAHWALWWCVHARQLRAERRHERARQWVGSRFDTVIASYNVAFTRGQRARELEDGSAAPGSTPGN